MIPALQPLEIRRAVNRALTEDAAQRDVTTALLIPGSHIARAVIIANENCTLCGLGLVKAVFRKLDRRVAFRALCRDGQKVKKGKRIAVLRGPTRALLKGERTVLNFLGHLSGIATKTSLFVAAARPYKAEIFDTRKTTPGLRVLEKYAVRCGGGQNHRFDLSEMVLVKDNHRMIHKNGSLQNAIRRVRAATSKTLEVEVDSLKEFKDVLQTAPHIILLDNMTVAQIKAAVRLRNRAAKKKRPHLEVSGGVNLKTLRAIARTGVDRISVGELTHSVNAVDFSMDLVR